MTNEPHEPPVPSDTRQFQFPPPKQEIRPTLFNVGVNPTPDGGAILSITHPMAGDVYIYQLAPEQRKQLREALSALHVVGADEMPADPEAG